MLAVQNRMHPAIRAFPSRERDFFIVNLLVRDHFIIVMIGPASRHGSLNSLFQVALHLPS